MEDTAGARPETFSELLDLLSKLRLHEVTSPSQPRDILFEKRPCHPSLTITVAGYDLHGRHGLEQFLNRIAKIASCIVKCVTFSDGARQFCSVCDISAAIAFRHFLVYGCQHKFHSPLCAGFGLLQFLNQGRHYVE